MISDKVWCGKKGFKYFNGYKDLDKIKPLWIMLPKMSRSDKYFDDTKYLPFSIKDEELLAVCNKIWNRVSNLIKKNLIVNHCIMKNKIKTKYNKK